ncbi:MAG: hypothetical protein BECKG1743E_GA0114224_104481, partial [Candidatus Kentron sp. G]
GFKARGRRIVHYVTVIATQKLDDKDKQVGIFFDRNRLSLLQHKGVLCSRLVMLVGCG